SLSGQGAGGSSGGIGGAAAYNEISTVLRAYINGATVTSTLDSIVVSAVSSATIQTIAAGGSLGGSVGVAGSVSINALATNVQAYITQSTATANDNLSVLGASTDSITAYGGTIGGGAVGVAGSGVVNTVDNITRGYINTS